MGGKPPVVKLMQFELNDCLFLNRIGDGFIRMENEKRNSGYGFL